MPEVLCFSSGWKIALIAGASGKYLEKANIKPGKVMVSGYDLVWQSIDSRFTAAWTIGNGRQTLSEQLTAAIMESILAGEWQGGEALPTEPELAEQFGVSRVVIRDATRMLAAQGLIEAQHGRGVFVTDSGVEPFGDALLLALRRAGLQSGM